MGTKKIILIVAAVAIIGFFVFFMRKKGNGSADAASESIKSMGANMANNAVDAIKEVVLSDSDEEYNLLRQEYTDRFGSAPKSSWSKAMIQQQINEYDRKKEALDKLVEVSGSTALEQTATMSEEEILRLIETEKQRVEQEKKEKLRNAQLQYKSATNMQPSADLDTPEKLVDAMEKELINANEEYKAFMGVYPTGCVSAVQVRSKLANEQAALRNEWQNRKNYLNEFAANIQAALDGRGKRANKDWLMKELFPGLLNMPDRDFKYTVDTCWTAYNRRGLDFFGGGVMWDIVNNPIVYFRENAAFVQQILSRTEELNGRGFGNYYINDFGQVVFC